MDMQSCISLSTEERVVFPYLACLLRFKVLASLSPSVKWVHLLISDPFLPILEKGLSSVIPRMYSHIHSVGDGVQSRQCKEEMHDHSSPNCAYTLHSSSFSSVHRLLELRSCLNTIGC